MAIEELATTLTTVWKFDYEPKIKALRELYEVAKKEQWNAAADVPWQLEVDPSGDILDPRQDPFREFDFVKALPEEAQTELSVRNAAWILSQFLHGEQGALLCCGQLVEVVPDIDGKLYAATQVIDEARHVEVFHRYIERLDQVHPIDPTLQAVLNQILSADLWQMKCVGMQVIVESLAMGSFKIMKEGSRDELLRHIVGLTSQDEARHVAFGMAPLRRHVRLDPGLRGRLRLTVERRHAALEHTAGLNEEVFDALVVLGAGSWDPDAIRRGWERVAALKEDMDAVRRRHLGRLGFTTAEAEALSALHTRNFM